MEDVVKKVALSVTLKAKLGKEEEVAAFLAGALSLVAQEAGTIAWYAFRIDQRTFGIFDSFGSDAARQAHLQGAFAAALLGHAEELLDGRPRCAPSTFWRKSCSPERRALGSWRSFRKRSSSEEAFP